MSTWKKAGANEPFPPGPQYRLPGRTALTLVVGNLPGNFSAAELRALFESFAGFKLCKITGRYTRQQKEKCWRFHSAKDRYHAAKGGIEKRTPENGKMVSQWVLKNFASGLVEFDNVVGGQQAIQSLHGYVLEGTALWVRESN